VAEPAALVAGYEQLRERVLSGRPDGWRLGHGILAGRGVVAWSAACAAATSAAAGTPAHHPSSAPSTPSPSTTTPCPPTTGALSSPPGAGQIVAVLAQMALAHA
jgi:hypothetical protein